MKLQVRDPIKIRTLEEYRKYLYGCRFCPMCKPASDVANVTFLESHTTRARAMMLWRILNGYSDFSERDVELLYQSTLDSISWCWCVHHYPVSEYILSARNEVLKRGIIPDCVKQVLDESSNNISDGISLSSDTIFLSSEIGESGSSIASEIALEIIKMVYSNAEEVRMNLGNLHFNLGDFDETIKRANGLVELLDKTKTTVKYIIADGPYTLWMLVVVFPSLGIKLPDSINVLSLDEVIYRTLKEKKLDSQKISRELKDIPESKVFFYDARVASFLAEQLTEQAAILPEFDGPEEALGKGDIYELPRKILKTVGFQSVHSVWSRSLAKSCGVEGGLWKTYPSLAEKLSKKCIEIAADSGAEILVTNSFLCYQQLKKAGESSIKIKWLPELFNL